MAERIMPVSYRFEENRIEPMPYFLYEVSVYHITKDTAHLINSKFFKSDKLLTIKNGCERYGNYYKYVDFLGAPMSFIEENNLPIFEFKTKKRKRK